MLSILAQRVAFRLPTAASTTLLRSCAPFGASQATLTRTFVTTPRLAFPAAKAAKSTKTATTQKKSVDKKPKAAAKKPKKTAKDTKKTAAKPRVSSKAKPERVVIRPEDRPPKPPGSPWIAFWRKQAATHKGGKLEDVQQAAKEAGAQWRNMSDAERKPFVDEFEALREDYIKRRDEYLANVDPKIVKELNRRAQKRDPEARLIKRRSKLAGSPATPFLRFYNETFRPRYIAENPGASLAESARAGGAAWRALSEREKQPYLEAAAKARAEWMAAQKA